MTIDALPASYVVVPFVYFVKLVIEENEYDFVYGVGELPVPLFSNSVNTVVPLHIIFHP